MVVQASCLECLKLVHLVVVPRIRLCSVDPRKWFAVAPLSRSLACVYCGGPADTSDHTPPRCLLPKPLPEKVLAMTVPACSRCNSGFSHDEMRAAAIVSTVSFMEADRVAVAPAGWIAIAMQRDAALREFVHSRLATDGVFHPDRTVIEVLSRIMTKTTAGLLFYEFGRMVPLSDIRVLAIEHVKNVNPMALIESHRRCDNAWAEVTPSGRELERQVFAVFGNEPPHITAWRKYVPEFFEYMFIRRSNNKLLTGIKLHETLTVLLECPWPSRAGPRRKGRPRKR